MCLCVWWSLVLHSDDYTVLESGETSAQTIDKFVEYGAEFEKHVQNLVINRYLPLDIVEDKDFRAVCYSLNAKHKAITKRTLADNISKAAAATRVQLKVLLQDEYVATTGDKWSSRANHSYLGVTVHWINGAWQLCSVPLGCEVHADHVFSSDPLAGDGLIGDERAGGAASGLVEATKVAQEAIKKMNNKNKKEAKSGATAILKQFRAAWAQYDIPETHVVATVTDTEATMNLMGSNMKEAANVDWIGCADHRVELASGWITTFFVYSCILFQIVYEHLTHHLYTQHRQSYG